MIVPVLMLLGLVAQTEPAPSQREATLRRLAEDRVRSQVLRKEETSILKALREIDSQLEDHYAEQKELAAKLDRIDRDLNEMSLSLSEIEEESSEARTQLTKRAYAMVRLQHGSTKALIALAGDDRVARRKLKDRLHRVLEYDAALIKRLSESSEKYRARSRDLQAERAAHEQTEREISEAVEKGLELREDRSALLTAVRGERGVIDRLRREIARSAKRLGREAGIVRPTSPPPPLLPGGVDKQKGRLPWPVSGTVEVGFGARVHPASGLILSQTGIDVRAPHGDPVHAVFPGVVAHRGQIPGLGRTLILEHDGWFSVYGHLDRYRVGEGAHVKAGSTIGNVGDTGSRKGPYLYFELRQGTQAVDPLVWLAP